MGASTLEGMRRVFWKVLCRRGTELGKRRCQKNQDERVLEDQHSVPMLQEVPGDEDQNAPVTLDNVKSLLTALSVPNVADDLGLETKGRSETNKVYRDSHFRSACLRNTE